MINIQDYLSGRTYLRTMYVFENLFSLCLEALPKDNDNGQFMYVCCYNGATRDHACMYIIQVKHGEHDSFFKNCYKSLLWSSMGMAMSPWERVIVEA